MKKAFMHGLSGLTTLMVNNSQLFDKVKHSRLDIREMLVLAIDTKDRYTFGHSRRVAWLAVELAQAAGFEPSHINQVRTAALMHDLGKIGIPEAVLLKLRSCSMKSGES